MISNLKIAVESIAGMRVEEEVSMLSAFRLLLDSYNVRWDTRPSSILRNTDIDFFRYIFGLRVGELPTRDDMCKYSFEDVKSAVLDKIKNPELREHVRKNTHYLDGLSQYGRIPIICKHLEPTSTCVIAHGDVGVCVSRRMPVASKSVCLGEYESEEEARYAAEYELCGGHDYHKRSQRHGSVVLCKYGCVSHVACSYTLVIEQRMLKFAVIERGTHSHEINRTFQQA